MLVGTRYHGYGNGASVAAAAGLQGVGRTAGAAGTRREGIAVLLGPGTAGAWAGAGVIPFHQRDTASQCRRHTERYSLHTENMLISKFVTVYRFYYTLGVRPWLFK